MTQGERIRETMHDRLPRFLAAGVDYNDVQQILGRIRCWEDLCAAWVAMGVQHEALADAAPQASNTVTAGEAYVRAALYFHFAQLCGSRGRGSRGRC